MQINLMAELSNFQINCFHTSPPASKCPAGAAYHQDSVSISIDPLASDTWMTCRSLLLECRASGGPDRSNRRGALNGPAILFLGLAADLAYDRLNEL
jgi:hypothetical protein